MTESIEDRLRTLGIALPPVSAPVANYGSLPENISVEVEAIFAIR